MAYFNNKRILMTCAYEGGAETTTVKNLLTAKRNANSLFSNYQGTSVEGLIVYDDTENVTDMSYMFSLCRHITTIPLLDTSNVFMMSYMFRSCQELTTLPLFDTSNVQYMDSMFLSCSALTTIPTFNTSRVTTMGSMFSNCSALTTVPALDVSRVGNMTSMFNNCSSLTEIHMTGMKVSFDISASTLFTESALVEILNNLATVTSTLTLTMGATNLAKLTQAEIGIATNKGWTLA